MRKNYQSYSDRQLADLVKSNKGEVESAFTELYSRYSSRIYAYCVRVLGNTEEANDVFQEAFVRFYNSAKLINSETKIFPYLLMITRNCCLNHKREKVTTTSFDEANLMNDKNLQVSQDSYENAELLELIGKALELLDFDYKEIFVLRQYQGLGYEEIADITGENVGVIRTKFWRAKEKIKDILQPYLNDMVKAGV